MIHHIKRATRILVFWSLVSLALLLSVTRLALREADQFKSELETLLSGAVDAPCRIGSMYVNIYGANPKLVLNNIDVQTQNQGKAAVVLDQIQLRLDLIKLLFNWDLWASTRITLIGAELSVHRQADGAISIAGLKSGGEEPLWLLQSGQYELLDSKVSWLDKQLNTPEYQFDGVDIFIDNVLPEQQHRINLALKLPESVQGELHVSTLLTGDVFAGKQVNVKLFVEGEIKALQNIPVKHLPPSLRFNTGRAQFQLWVTIHDTILTSISGTVAVYQAELKTKDNQTFAVEDAGSSFAWENRPVGWRLVIKDIHLKDKQQAWRQGDFSLAAQHLKQESVSALSGHFKHLDLAGFSYWALKTQLFSTEQLKFIKEFGAKGSLQHFFWYADAHQNQYAFNGDFSHVSVNSYKKLPGVNNLTGFVFGDQDAGYIHFKSNSSQLLLPSLYKQQLNLSEINGKINWRNESGFWVLNSSGLSLAGSGLTMDLYGKGQIPKNLHDKLDVELHADLGAVDNLRDLIDYLPSRLIGQENMGWINSALLGGRLINGTLELQGNPDNFPFADGQGFCEVRLELEDFGLNYHPKWPVVTEMNASVTLVGDRLQVDVEKANVNGALVHKTTGLVTSLYNSDFIDLKGQVVGTVGQAIGFIQQTPLAYRIYPVLQAISIQGKNTIDLAIKLARNETVSDQVYGIAHVTDAQFLIHGVDIPVTGVKGDIVFTQDAVESGPVEAHALGYPVSLKIDAFEDYYTVTADARTDVEHLRLLALSPHWKYASGGFDYRFRLEVPYDNRANEKMHISSNLVGLELALPDFLSKTASQVAPIALEMNFINSRLLPLKLNYWDRFNVAMELDTEQGQLYSADIVIGKGLPSILHKASKRLTINQDEFELSPWLALLDSEQSDSQAGWVDEVKLQTAHLSLNGQDFGPVTLQLKHHSSAWQGNINSRFISGQFQAPEAIRSGGKLDFDLQFIDLDYLQGLNLQASGSEISPLEVPLFKLFSKQLLWRQVNQGELSIDTSRSLDGLLFEEFSIEHPGRKLQLYGSRWWIKNHQSRTELAGILEMQDFGIYLSEIGVSDDMRQSPSEIGFSANWPGAPFAMQLTELQGSVNLRIGAGRVMGVEPGIGRLLGVLDIRQLARRLRFDFSDVYAEGLSYDYIQGDFQIDQGLANTQNLFVDALPALIKITGTSDLVNQSYDQVVTVLPKSSAAIPIAGTIVDGVTALVTKSMTGKTKEGLLFGMQFALDGQWQNPELTPLHHNEGLITKAWLGITDFSWLEK